MNRPSANMTPTRLRPFHFVLPAERKWMALAGPPPLKGRGPVGRRGGTVRRSRRAWGKFRVEELIEVSTGWVRRRPTDCLGWTMAPSFRYSRNSRAKRAGAQTLRNRCPPPIGPSMAGQAQTRISTRATFHCVTPGSAGHFERHPGVSWLLANMQGFGFRRCIG